MVKLMPDCLGIKYSKDSFTCNNCVWRKKCKEVS